MSDGPDATPDADAPRTDAQIDVGLEEPPAGENTKETFPRSYVEQLRHENGKYRQRAQKADTYAQRLHTELVRATGRLADPTELGFDEAHLDDADALAAALDELVARKPHLGIPPPERGDRAGSATVTSYRRPGSSAAAKGAIT